MVLRYYHREAIAALADRMWARGTSRLFQTDQPTIASDCRATAGLLRAALASGWPVGPIEAEVGVEPEGPNGNAA